MKDELRVEVLEALKWMDSLGGLGRPVHECLDRLIAKLEAALPLQSDEREKWTPPSAIRDAAYDQIDRFLRNNLDDADYADYSQALDCVYAPSGSHPQLDGGAA